MAPAQKFPADKATASRERKIKDIKDTMKSIVQSLCYRWAFDLKIPEQESPSSRTDLSLEQQCVTMIIGICWKDKKGLLAVAEEFEDEAYAKWRGWVNKPKAERGTVPEKTRHRPCPVSDEEREHLLDCLHKRLSIVWEPIKKPKTPKRFIATDASINDSPIHFSLTPNVEGPSGHIAYPKMKNSSTDFKRSRDETLQDTSPVKKAKSDNIPRSNSTYTMPPPDQSFGHGRILVQDKGPISANTSFASTANISNVSSVFSQGRDSFLISTQETVPDDEPILPQRKSLSSAFTTRQPDKNPPSSEFGASSSFERGLAGYDEEVITSNTTTTPEAPADEELSQDFWGIGLQDETDPAEQELRECLANVFPKVPHILDGAPLPVLYEITRAFLYAGVSLAEFKTPVRLDWTDYDKLWNFLKTTLGEESLPERCSGEVWNSALKGYKRGFQSVVFSGSLSFEPTSIRPLFKLQLNPLKLDESHRLGRQFGHDRFLELFMPQITGYKLPENVQALVKLHGESKWREIICRWLVQSKHPLLGRQWQPFFLKPKDRQAKKRASEDPSAAAHRLYFFALDGFDFIKNARLLRIPSRNERHPSMSIAELLDKVRPTHQNGYQSYLKLFSRTALAVSRNSETLVLEKDQILFEKDICLNGEVMTDGAGLISPTLAMKVTHKLGLTYRPSGFQARLGEAKGFWVVDYTDKTGTDWIKVYELQQKWKRSTENGGVSDDPSHRTFEVLNKSAPLQSADLNTQLLPLLVDRAGKKAKAMRDAIATLLRDGLAQELAEMQEAMKSPFTFKKWVRDNKSNIVERLKAGAVPFRGGLPLAIEERLNIMLDAGFDPKELTFMNELARLVFKSKCAELKQRMNITVGRSAYIYMVPDFWGVLEEGEVYVDFSSFTDHVSGFSGAVLSDDNVLVARSPAHFISDIQKVRAVVKPELMGLKDVIVFPTKGNPSLAAKLSGGDYDGDMAWVCWEPSIVDNFVTANVPEMPDLVEEGLLQKDTTTYEELVFRDSSPTCTFLKKAFEFNLQQSMLGKCTNFKDDICYTHFIKGLISPSLQFQHQEEALYLSKLLSDLVDQAKQGYIFNDELWKKFKERKIKTKTRPVAYKGKDGGVCTRQSKHILDYLVWVAHDAIDKSLEEFFKNFSKTSAEDEDLVARYSWACGNAEKHKDWRNLLDALNRDLQSLKTEWRERMRRCDGRGDGRGDETKSSNFDIDVVELHAKFRGIQPHIENALTDVLLCDEFRNPDLTGWALLKASALFASYNKKHNVFPWYMGGIQLCYLKAHYGGFGTPHSVIPSMYILLRPDNSMIRKLQGGGHVSWDDNASVMNVEDLADREDD